MILFIYLFLLITELVKINVGISVLLVYQFRYLAWLQKVKIEWLFHRSVNVRPASFFDAFFKHLFTTYSMPVQCVYVGMKSRNKITILLLKQLTVSERDTWASKCLQYILISTVVSYVQIMIKLSIIGSWGGCMYRC